MGRCNPAPVSHGLPHSNYLLNYLCKVLGNTSFDPSHAIDRLGVLSRTPDRAWNCRSRRDSRPSQLYLQAMHLCGCLRIPIRFRMLQESNDARGSDFHRQDTDRLHLPLWGANGKRRLTSHRRRFDSAVAQRLKTRLLIAPATHAGVQTLLAAPTLPSCRGSKPMSASPTS